MAAPKIKKKGSSAKASPAPRQGTIPCLVIVAFAFIVLAVIFYFALRSAG